MRSILGLLLLTASLFSSAQPDLLQQYQIANSLIEQEKFSEAYPVLKELESKWDTQDTLYDYVLWYYILATAQIEEENRMTEQWDTAIQYGLEALDLIEKAKPRFNEQFAQREYWMVKNVLVSHFSSGQLDKAKTYRDVLYKAYKNKELPEGLEGYFNFEFFTIEDKNVWGYEWFPELGDPETKGSFSKIVYYVYSTNPDGSDKDHLYSLHVLKFHKLTPNSVDFDYVLTKRLDTATNEVSGTFYAYTYKKEIDYPKLRSDIREVVKGNYEPNTKTIIRKN